LELAQKVKSIKEMDQNELVEALPGLREEALKAEKALRVAQERVHEANARMTDVPAFVEVHDDHLVVNVKRRDKNFVLLSSIKLPLEHVVGAEADPHVEWEVWRGWRVPGVKVPGVRFYAMRGRRDRTLVIRSKDETYDHLITEVQDPAEVAEKINAAVGALSNS
jgi:seryl-tRNA synthetase